MYDFGKKLREYRKRKMYESGRKEPSFAALAKSADILEIALDGLRGEYMNENN